MPWRTESNIFPEKNKRNRKSLDEHIHTNAQCCLSLQQQRVNPLWLSVLPGDPVVLLLTCFFFFLTHQMNARVESWWEEVETSQSSHRALCFSLG